MGKLIVFGGTFNPIHNGHLVMIRSLAARPDIDRVLVIPTLVPPHKVCDGLLPGLVRLHLCRLAVAGIDKVEVSDLELRRPDKSYTFDTLTALHAADPTRDLALCCGGDMIATLPTWHRYTEILALAEILAVRRAGVDGAVFDAAVSRIRADGGRVEVLPLAVPDLSSTQLRRRPDLLAEGVPPAVADWIRRHHLYENGEAWHDGCDGCGVCGESGGR